jgi:hypothetical protein
MKAGLIVALLFSLTAGSALAAQQDSGASAPGTVPAKEVAAAPSEPAQLTRPSDSYSAPLWQSAASQSRPFFGKRFLQFPRRMLRLMNPFAPVESKGELRVPDYSPRAWSSTIGWRPGASAFSDPVTHESSMGLSWNSK